jgi:thiamine biosynthesis lipoprotein
MPLDARALITAAGLVSIAAAAPADFPTEAEALASFFPDADAFTRELGLVQDPETLKLRGPKAPRHLFRQVARHEGRVLGYAVVSEVMGKARPITYMLAVDARGKVLGVEVLVYRESHGGEIGRAAFRSQFTGKNATSRLALDDDIRNIAGATISCRAITDGVADLLDVLAAVPAAGVAEAPEATVDEPPVSTPAGAFMRTQVHMNAPLSITLFPRTSATAGGGERKKLMAATDAAFAETKRLESLLSLFQPTSDVARLNAAAGVAEVEIAPETRALLTAALELAQRTQGAYDPVAGALTRLIKATGGTPSEAARRAAASQTGSHLLVLTPTGARLTRRGAALDLGGSAKGFALDRIAAKLTGLGYGRGVLNFGGQVLVFGGDALPVESRGFGPVQLGRGSLATSGDDERAPRTAGQLARSHLVDPRTSSLVQPHGAVQVLADTALEADALATALYVLGPEAGWALCLEAHLAARFFGPTGGRRTPAWESRMETTR